MLMRVGAINIIKATPIIHRSDWLGNFLKLVPDSITYLFRYSFFSVFSQLGPGAHINPFLWTMHFEMVGSIMVFALLLCYRHVRNALGLILATAFVLILPNDGFANYACFLFGVCISAARVGGVFERFQAYKYSQIWSWLIFVAFAVASGAAHSTGHLKGRAVIFAVPLLLAIFTNRALVAFFSSRASRFLGAISFPIYLVQFPVLASFTSGAIVWANGARHLSATVIWLIAISSLLICVLAAIAFLPIETLTKRCGNRSARAILLK